MNITTYFWLALLPLILTLIFVWFLKRHTNSALFLDNWIIILIYLMAVIPILAWVTPIILILIIKYGLTRYDGAFLKDTKLNRFLFNSYF